MPPQQTSQLPDTFIVLDIEASGLHPTSFPIEIAWAGPNIAAKTFLIKPDTSWAIEDWDEKAEDIHHISLDQVQREGADPKDIVRALLEDAANKTIISDAVSFDQNWLRMVFEAAGQPITPNLQDFTTWLGLQAKRMNINPSQLIETLQQFEEDYPPTHRASDDVNRLLQLIEACLKQN